jgi:hypothetical protein
MPPRHAYWTILVDNQATAFRAHDAEELLPTLNRLREKNASAVLKWFERGQLFDSRDAAREQGFGRGERRWEGPRPERERPPRRRPMPEIGDRSAAAERPPGADAERPRNRDWRPGGEHRDPRQKYRDAKKAKWQRFKKQIRERHEQRGEERRSFDKRPDHWRPKGPPGEHGDRDRGFDGRRERPPFDSKQPPRKPWGAKPAGGGGRKPWSAKPVGGGGRKPWGARPSGAGDRKPWGSKPEGARNKKPWGAKSGAPARKPWTSDRGGPQGRGERRPAPGVRPPRRDWHGDRPPKRRKDEDE